MSQPQVTRTITITATRAVWERFERFLAFFHYNAGHTGVFAMCFDGDGEERLRVDPPPNPAYRKGAQATSNYFGSAMERARSNGYIAERLKSDQPWVQLRDDGTVESRSAARRG